MSRKRSWVTALLLAAAAVRAEEPPAPAPAPAPPGGAAILEQVTARLPRDPLQIEGELKADPRDGKPGRQCRVQLRLEYGASTPQARYTIMDAFGEDLEQITVLRPAGGKVTWHYARGYPLKEGPLPDPRQPIQGTDLTWSDLSLSFLWWPDAALTGTESVLDRECFVIRAKAPADEPSSYAAVRLWIDRQHLMLLKAEGLDAEGKPVRRIEVKSIRKINEEWMVQDLNVTSLPARTRTSLRIREVEKPDPEAANR